MIEQQLKIIKLLILIRYIHELQKARDDFKKARRLSEGTAFGLKAFKNTDSIGNITAITDKDGNIVERYKYNIYGSPEIYNDTGNPITESAIGNDYLFQSRRYDPELHLYYYRARTYDPEIGRFLQTDPIGYKDSMNLYQAMNMNGWGFVDPWGLAEVKMNTIIFVMPGNSKILYKKPGSVAYALTFPPVIKKDRYFRVPVQPIKTFDYKIIKEKGYYRLSISLILNMNIYIRESGDKWWLINPFVYLEGSDFYNVLKHEFRHIKDIYFSMLEYLEKVEKKHFRNKKEAEEYITKIKNKGIINELSSAMVRSVKKRDSSIFYSLMEMLSNWYDLYLRKNIPESYEVINDKIEFYKIEIKRAKDEDVYKRYNGENNEK